MKNISLRRFVAYLIDLFLVSVITSFLSYIPFLNPSRDAYNKQYNEVLEILEHYETEEITMEEYQNQFVRLSYDLNKTNINYTVINLVVIIAYFGIFQWQNKGQTLGKKLLKLKVVSSKDNQELGVLSYLIRSIIVNNVFITILQIIVLSTFDVDHYYSLYSNLNMVGYILIYITAFLIFIRTDHRGLHDLIAGTKVISLKEEEETPEATYEEVKEKPKKSTKSKK